MESDEIITAMDSTSTKITNTIATNVTSATSINCHSKKVRDCYIVSIVVVLLLITIIICYYCTKQKGINAQTI